MNLFSKYGRLALLAEEVGKKAFFVAPSGQMSAMQRHLVPDEDGVTRVYSTLDAAIGSCVADRGDKIYVLPTYTETLESAGAITVDVAGVEIVGLGHGNSRPQLTFSTNTAASVLVSANNVKISGIIGVAGVDGLLNPFNVTGNNVVLDLEWQDASAAVEAACAVRLDTADGADLKLVYKGFTAGNALVRAVAVDDCDNVRINIDGYGVCSTAWVNMVDAASTNVAVTGKTYTQGITNGSRDVVDTITGSTWFGRIDDMSAGAPYSGGSAAAWATDDITALSAKLDVIDDFVDTEVDAIKAVTDLIPDLGAMTTMSGEVTAIKAVTDVLPDAGALTTLAGEVTAIKAVTDVLPDAGALTSLASDITDIKAVTDVLPDAGVLSSLAQETTVTGGQTASGTHLLVQKTLASSAIVTGGVDVTGAASGGDLYLEDVIFETDGTGLATGTNVILAKTAGDGSSKYCEEAVANLGVSKTIELQDMSVANTRGTLASGNKIQIKSTGLDCTGAGTLTITLVFRRIDATATVVAAA